MFKQLYNNISCMLMGHETTTKLCLKENLVVEHVKVFDKEITCQVTIDVEIAEHSECARCHDKFNGVRSTTRDVLVLTLDLPYVAGLYSEGLVDKAETLFENTLFMPMAKILANDFAPAILGDKTAVSKRLDKAESRLKAVDRVAAWGPVAGKDILAYRDELVETEHSLAEIDRAVKRYLETIGE